MNKHTRGTHHPQGGKAEQEDDEGEEPRYPAPALPDVLELALSSWCGVFCGVCGVLVCVDVVVRGFVVFWWMG